MAEPRAPTASAPTRVEAGTDADSTASVENGVNEGIVPSAVGAGEESLAIAYPPPPASPSALDRVRSGEVDAALEMLRAASCAAGDLVAARAWVEVGDGMLASGRAAEAAECLTRALEIVVGCDPAFESSVRRALSQARARCGDHRSAADVLLPLVADRTRAAPSDLAQVGALLVGAGDAQAARPWLEEAVASDPADVETAALLIEVLGGLRDRSGIDALATVVDGAEIARSKRALWLASVAAVKRRLGDIGGAERAVTLARGVVRAEPRVLEELFHLGREASRDEWIDEALHALCAVAVDRGDRTRAFVTACVLVARGTASPEARLTYEALRGRVSTRPRAPIGCAWFERWLPAGGAVSQSPSDAPIPWGPPIEITGELADVLHALALPLAVDRFETLRLVEDGEASMDYAVRTHPLPAIGLSERATGRLIKRFRFEVARAMVALQNERLARALHRERSRDVEPARAEPVSEEQGVLDRAALVLSGDPSIALEVVGARSPRGKALSAFAVSEELPALWERLGLGVQRTVAKEGRWD